MLGNGGIAGYYRLPNVIHPSNYSKKIDDLLKRIEVGKKIGIYSSVKAHRKYLVNCITLHEPLLFIAKNEEDALEYFLYFSENSPYRVEILPAFENIFAVEQIDIIPKTSQQRIQAIDAIKSKEPAIIITYPKAILIPIQRREENSRKIFLKKESILSRDDLINNLIKLSYKKSDKARLKGEFSLKGDMLTIFPINSEFPYRISFFDDFIEDIKVCNSETMQPISKVDSVEILSASELYFDYNEILEKLKIDEIKRRVDAKRHVAEALRKKVDLIEYLLFQGFNCDGLPYLIAFDKINFNSIFSLLSNTYIVLDEMSEIIFNIDEELMLNKKAFDQGYEKGELLEKHEDVLLSKDKFISEIEKIGYINLSSNVIDEDNYEIVENFHVAPCIKYYQNYNLLISDIKDAKRNNKTMYIFAGSDEKCQNFIKSLEKNDIYISQYKSGSEKNNVYFLPYTYECGFIDVENSFSVIGTKDLLGNLSTNKKAVRKRYVFTIPSMGDYVVHETYGIGKCIGIEHKTVNGIEREYIRIDYAENDRLFLPIDQLDKIQKYSGHDEAPQLTRLGTKDFANAKKKARNSIRKIAFDLIQLYAQREKQKGFVYSKDTDIQMEMEAEFEFEPTNDQLSAISDIKEDMEKGKLMDRLLCGDVGFGKTEVALRAAFKTVMDSKQVAIIAPTTLLSRQHYILFKKRLEKFGVHVALLNRFTSQQIIKEKFKEIEAGNIDIIVGTHKLLNSKIAFHDLGLLIVDEEQRFGVEQKEKIKRSNKHVNILSLSATPIPRTLSMSLNGIRDISIIAEPPKNRLPIKTSVQKLDFEIVKRAIEFEIKRDGQVFVLFNRIDKLEELAIKIESLVPDARVIVCYGGMKSSTLENRINAFYENKANVLVSTSIIENGIDIPNANTLIVIDSDRYGLSQLYQIRGRVGRSSELAYAYFFYDGVNLTENAKSRLSALKEYNELGSGFKIAMRDLEIRGAGNLLGAEQSGHIVNIGYELYSKLLDDEIKKLQGYSVEEENITMIIALNSYIPSDYIESLDEKLKLYKEISEIKDENDMNNLTLNLNKSYGEVPAEIQNLMYISYAKNISYEFNIEKIQIKDNLLSITFNNLGEKFVSLMSEVTKRNLNYEIKKVKKNSLFEVVTKNSALDNLKEYISIIKQINSQNSICEINA